LEIITWNFRYAYTLFSFVERIKSHYRRKQQIAVDAGRIDGLAQH